MSRSTRHLCLDRVHCPLAKTRTLIRTDDPSRPHVCPLAKPECTRELCEAPAPRGSGGMGTALVLLLIIAGGVGLAWQQGWLPHDLMHWVDHKQTATPVSDGEMEAVLKQKKDAEAAILALRQEKERQAAELDAAKAKAEKAEEEVTRAKEAAAKAMQASVKPPPPADAPPPKSAVPVGTVADDLAKFFPGAASPSKP